MYLLAYDFGTSGVKTCLYKAEDKLELVASALETYELRILPGGGAEQDPQQWWSALVEATAQLRSRFPAEMDRVEGLSFCSQMQAVVLVGADGRHLRPAMSYMDQRATEQKQRGLQSGVKIQGMNLGKVLTSLYRTGAVSASVKDPMWKYLWVRDNEPQVFAQVRYWLDVKEYLIGRMTGRYIMTRDSAFAALLLDIRSPQPRWATKLARSFGVNPEHLPEIIVSTQAVGTLLPEVAKELGLPPTTVVYAGGGDASLIGVGAGACAEGDTHVYWGTSGWVSTVSSKRHVDISHMIATVDGADPGKYNYFAELETAGKCFEWVRDHLAADSIKMYLEHRPVTEDPETRYTSLYAYMSEVLSRAQPGSGGVIFTPWLHGNRCPFEDANARAMFFGLTLETGKTEMLRAVIEGVCFHLRWFLETADRKIPSSPVLRFVGGGALSDVTSQILADVTGRPVETTPDPQDVGSIGAALLVLVGAGRETSIPQAARRFVKIAHRYEPQSENRQVYDRMYQVFKGLYPANRKAFASLAQPGR